jgi:NifU-like protein involved in Fe-S cluster formation
VSMLRAYPARVRELFQAPPAAGPLPPGSGERRVGEAGDAAAGAWIRFEARVADGRIATARFRAWGCPYAIAAAALVAGRLEGVAPAAAGEFDVQALAAELDLPPERLGRLLVVADAARGLAASPAAAGG